MIIIIVFILEFNHELNSTECLQQLIKEPDIYEKEADLINSFILVLEKLNKLYFISTHVHKSVRRTYLHKYTEFLMNTCL